MNNSRKRILYLQYTNAAAYPSLEHSSDILLKRGWEALFLESYPPEAGALAFAERPFRIRKRLRTPEPGWRQKLQYILFCGWAFFRAIRRKPAWIYASDPLACLPALLIHRGLGIKTIYHEHDTPDTSSPGFFMRACFLARRALARRAEACVLPNADRASWFAEEIPGTKAVPTVWNCPALEEAAADEVPKKHSETFRILYHGSIVPSRLPRSVIEALALLPKQAQLRVVGYETIGHPGYCQELLRLAKAEGIENRIEWIGAVVGRQELFRLARECDVGLALMPKTPSDVNFRFMVGASNKPFDYLACGLPLLVTDLADWKAWFVEPGYGGACDPEDPKNIAQTLRWFLEHPEEARAMGERGRQRILSDWNYEKQFAPVLERLE